jgi:hypothetical protein
MMLRDSPGVYGRGAAWRERIERFHAQTNGRSLRGVDRHTLDESDAVYTVPLHTVLDLRCPRRQRHRRPSLVDHPQRVDDETRRRAQRRDRRVHSSATMRRVLLEYPLLQPPPRHLRRVPSASSRAQLRLRLRKRTRPRLLRRVRLRLSVRVPSASEGNAKLRVNRTHPRSLHRRSSLRQSWRRRRRRMRTNGTQAGSARRGVRAAARLCASCTCVACTCAMLMSH